MGNNFANDFNHKLFVAFELINREYDNSLKLKLNHIFVAILVSAENFTWMTFYEFIEYLTYILR